MKFLAATLIALGLLFPGSSQAHDRVVAVYGPGYAYYPYGYPVPTYPGYYMASPPVTYYGTAPPVITSGNPYPAPVPYPAPAAAPGPNYTPVSPVYTDGSGRSCREFQTTTNLGPTYGTACLQPDGSWQSVQ